MSWSVQAIGTVDGVVKAIEKQAETMSGQSKVEYDEAMPHLIGLVKQTFNTETEKPPLINLQASGSGYTREGKQVQRSCTVKIEPLYGFVG